MNLNDPVDDLDFVYDALEELAKTSGKLKKREMLGEYVKTVPWLSETITYALHPFKHYHVTKIKYKQRRQDVDERCTDVKMIFGYLDALAEQSGTSNDQKDMLSFLSSVSEKTSIVVGRIIKKDLRCGVQVKTAVEFIPDIPIYEVMKPYGDNPFPGRRFKELVEASGGELWWGLKADGYRISYATVFGDGTVEYLSTNGKPYGNFDVFDDELILLAEYINDQHGIPYPMKFDGECVSKDGDFQTMQKQARRLSDVDREAFRFLVWGVVCDEPYDKCYNMLDILLTTSGEIYDFLKLVGTTTDKVFRLEHKPLQSLEPDYIRDLTKGIIAGGNEGILIKLPKHLHEFNRSKSWFRIKALYLTGEGIEVDLPVIGFEYGRKGTRLEHMLGKFICDYNGVIVKVAGKMSDKQREAWVDNLPSMIEVHADCETNDGSLRLPIFQRVRLDK